MQLCQVGAHLEALDELVFMAASEFFGIFLQAKPCHLNNVIRSLGNLVFVLTSALCDMGFFKLESITIF